MNKIKVLELFAGYGSQMVALKNIGVEIDHKESYISEWAVNPIIAYGKLHKPELFNKYVKYFKERKREEIESWLLNNFTLSTETKKIDGNYIPIKTYKRMKYDTLINLAAGIKTSNNLGSVNDIKGEQVKDMDLMTYSFPCQDISLAGRNEGIKEGTRSGLLYEVERILVEQNIKDRPQVLLMENVKNLVSKSHKEDFNIWCEKLEELGYENHWSVLNAKDYGIPQNRERVFMISIKKKRCICDISQKCGCIYHFSFPEKKELKYRLKHFLENKVDESYYLSNEHIARILNWNAYEKPLKKVLHRAGGSTQLVAIKTENYERFKNYFYLPHKESNGDRNRVWKGNILGTIPTQAVPRIMESLIPLRIRKITPKETLRLMGLNDIQINLISEVITTKTNLYKLAGNSIVVQVLEAIFKELFNLKEKNEKK